MMLLLENLFMEWWISIRDARGKFAWEVDEECCEDRSRGVEHVEEESSRVRNSPKL